jgi:protease I
LRCTGKIFPEVKSGEDRRVCGLRESAASRRSGTALAQLTRRSKNFVRRFFFMANELEGIKVAILATHGVEQSELTEPKQALEKAGADIRIVSPEKQIKAWQHTKWGRKFKVDESLESAQADSFDALVLPGGVMNPDYLRWNPQAVQFVEKFVTSQKPIAAICHGPWTLIEADAVRGRKLPHCHRCAPISPMQERRGSIKK